jgi:hypothetical protein
MILLHKGITLQSASLSSMLFCAADIAVGAVAFAFPLKSTPSIRESFLVIGDDLLTKGLRGIVRSLYCRLAASDIAAWRF